VAGDRSSAKPPNFGTCGRQKEAVLRDFLNFDCQRQKRLHGKLCAERMASYQWLCDFSSNISAPATTKGGQVIRSAAPVMQSHFSKPEDPMLQIATLSQEITGLTSEYL